jgi:hypothetical protein
VQLPLLDIENVIQQCHIQIYSAYRETNPAADIYNPMLRSFLVHYGISKSQDDSAVTIEVRDLRYRDPSTHGPGTKNVGAKIDIDMNSDADAAVSFQVTTLISRANCVTDQRFWEDASYWVWRFAGCVATD